jgi:hypothetical protein
MGREKSKGKEVKQMPDVGFYKECLQRTIDQMARLEKALEKGGMPLARQEKDLLIVAVEGDVKQHLDELHHFLKTGNFKDADHSLGFLKEVYETLV